MAEQVDFTNLRKQLEILGVESIGFITKILVENDKQVTGNLIKSLDFKIIKDIDGLFLQILAAPYFKNVDEGRRPGKMPPTKPIQKWADRRGIRIKNTTSQQTAFVIARSIGKKGIKPLNITNKLIDNIMKNKDTIIKAGVVKDIQDLIDKMVMSINKNVQ
jgi:hypothetical protein